MRLRQLTEKEREYLQKHHRWINPDRYMVAEPDTDKTQLVLIHKHGRRRTVQLEKGWK